LPALRAAGLHPRARLLLLLTLPPAATRNN
jgi:hypothetical protein